MKKITTLSLAILFVGGLQANECLDALDRYSEFSDKAKIAKSKQIKAKHEKISMEALKQAAQYCDHLKPENKADIKKALHDYNNR